MKYPSSKTLGIVVAGLAVAGLLVGCSGKLGAGSSEPTPTPTASKVTPIDLSDTTVLSTLCGDKANTTYKYVKTAAAAKPKSDQRLVLTDWGLTAPQVNDNAKLKTVVASLKTRAATPCKDVTAGDKVGVLNKDNTVTVVPIINSATSPVVIDSTQNAATPPVMQQSSDFFDINGRYTARSLSWQGLVDRVGDQQYYKDANNKFSSPSQLGFSWNDTLKFASVNKIVGGKVVGPNALAIQIYNQPGLTDEQARNQVRLYITPEVEKVIGVTVDQLPIQRINNGFMNTINAGTPAFPNVQPAFDTEKMVRVTLLPFVFDATGKVIGLNGSGAGIFIDCGNFHWVPVAMWKCTGPSCATIPPCPSGMEGTQPNCHFPPPPVTPPLTCEQQNGGLECKGYSPYNQGVVPLGAGQLTNGQQSADQKASGQTSGNVIDHPVPSGTQSGDTTSDLGSSNGQTGPSGVTAPGAKPGGDSQSSGTPTSAPQDTGNTSSDTGGTNGATCIPDPDTGQKPAGC